jgi:biopolymer transport protein ExbB
MITYFVQGGWVMYPLLAFSIVSLAVILERGLYYFRSRQRLDRFLSGSAAGQADVVPDSSNAVQMIRESLKRENQRGYLAEMTELYLSCAGEEQTVFDEKIFVAGSEQLRACGRRLPVLASIAHLAPLLGLFGTVLGMIEVFRKLEAAGGRADVGFLSGGIWVALITTAFGLLVAIPTLIAHHYFSGIVTERSENLQFLVSRLNVMIRGRTAARLNQTGNEKS